MQFSLVAQEQGFRRQGWTGTCVSFRYINKSKHPFPVLIDASDRYYSSFHVNIKCKLGCCDRQVETVSCQLNCLFTLPQLLLNAGLIQTHSTSELEKGADVFFFPVLRLQKQNESLSGRQMLQTWKDWVKTKQNCKTTIFAHEPLVDNGFRANCWKQGWKTDCMAELLKKNLINEPQTGLLKSTQKDKEPTEQLTDRRASW